MSIAATFPAETATPGDIASLIETSQDVRIMPVLSFSVPIAIVPDAGGL